MSITYVYFLRGQNSNLFKIGYSTDVDKRTRELQSNCPYELNLYAIIEKQNRLEASKTEREIHERLNKYRLRGEWFDAPLEVVDKVVELYDNDYDDFEVDELLGVNVPFGKYKGKPVELLYFNRDGYTDWLLEQAWFRRKYPEIYDIVINHYRIPENTLEKNKMQAYLTDDEYVNRLVCHVVGKNAQVIDCGVVEFEPDNGFNALLFADCVVDKKDHVRYNILVEFCFEVTEGYPNLLRQIKNTPAYKDMRKNDFELAVLLVSKYSSGVEFNRFKDIFENERIKILLEEQVKND